MNSKDKEEFMTREEYNEKYPEKTIVDFRKLNQWGELLYKYMEEHQEFKMEELIHTECLESYLIEQQEIAFDKHMKYTDELKRNNPPEQEWSMLQLIQYNYQIDAQAKELVIAELLT